MKRANTMNNLSRRKFIQYGSTAAGTAILATLGHQSAIATTTGNRNITAEAAADSIKIGIVYSTTGSIASVEKPLLNSTLLAIEHINAGTGAWVNNGEGISGQKVEPVVINPASDWRRYNQAVKQLADEENIVDVLGSNIVDDTCMRDLISLMYRELGPKGFFIGSEHPYVKGAHGVGKAELEKLGGSVIGDKYVELDTHQFGNLSSKIKVANPDFIVAGLVGNETELFQRYLMDFGMLEKYSSIGGYSTTFAPVDKAFTKQFQNKFGAKQTINYRIGTAYSETIRMAESLELSWA
ncbi:transporter substrate-binding protein [Adonisia turfae]|uniref:Leucine-binding protein domain-containing protein n=1 Tax=Adonisia turfae CCMR0081 TaxID=2292702 RepID=A0A6M0RGH3_9CYAN|nr:transporter substrate-binding protein [Adonisia turfae]NEZ55305.1 hypothetical protein [Adonisia turfae CCMR0081]